VGKIEIKSRERVSAAESIERTRSVCLNVTALLGLSVKTAETHRSNLMRKLGLHSIAELVLYSVRNQIVQIHPVETTVTSAAA